MACLPRWLEIRVSQNAIGKAVDLHVGKSSDIEINRHSSLTIFSPYYHWKIAEQRLYTIEI